MIAPQKDRLRREMRRRRAEISAADAVRATQQATDRLLEIPALARARTVALYSAVRHELGTAPLAKALTRKGIALAYPRVVRGQQLLAFHLVTSTTAMEPGIFGIPEPPEHSPAVPVTAVDLFVVPGLAFDRQGGRVGWGKGYYDFALSHAPDAVRVGFAYEAQLVPLVPRDESDVTMDCVITEAGVRYCGQRTNV